VLPFTLRKLLNRIRLLVPAKGGRALKAGPITLFLDDNAVQVDGDEPQQLTPHLTALLKMLMHCRGEVVTRKRLFREVWQTDYMGDTRTLDVHISWLRRKIEANARNPQYLKTHRGVGYILAV
jgi:DNA-binding response OmpR family regulator